MTAEEYCTKIILMFLLPVSMISKFLMCTIVAMCYILDSNLLAFPILRIYGAQY